MSIISSIERRHSKGRLLIAAIYLLLGVGGLTMVYPFLLMIAGSTKTAVDQKEMRIIPGYLRDDVLLYRKHIEGLFNESLEMMKIAYDTDVPSFEKIDPPANLRTSLVDTWFDFLESIKSPHYTYALGYVRADVSRGVHPRMLREFTNELKHEFDSDLDRLNHELGTEFLGWQSVYLLPDEYLRRRSNPSDEKLLMRMRQFKARQPHGLRYYFSAEGMYKTLYLKTQYTSKISAYNQAHDTQYESYDEIRLSRRLPAGTIREKEDWEQFVRDSLNLLWIRADPRAVPLYRQFLKAKYDSIDSLNRDYGTRYGSFDIPPPEVARPPDASSASGAVIIDWALFIQGWKDADTSELHRIPADMLVIDSLDFQFRDYLEGRFGSINDLNQSLGTAYSGYIDIRMPQARAHHVSFQKMTGTLRWEFTTRNYRTVLGFMAVNGRALWNTVIYCALAIATALIVNPMAAYAMSRFRLPSTYKILLFLMLTMAFPQMVNQIPIFLMLRDFGLLNTFWALILPGLANGYSIFILKGFFDSQPRELYESAALDGASEWVLFWQITMNLSKPVLAYIALFAFTGAYSNFMFALLICQDEKMWTLMPMLYQLQQRSGQGIVFASLIIAALPTFVVFLFAQNVIMRGIVVPVEK